MERRKVWLSAFVLFVASGAAHAQMISGQVQSAPVPPLDPAPVVDQFGAFQAPPYAYDQVRGEWVNLETELIKPIICILDGSVIAVANEADDRVVFLDTSLNLLGETVLGQGITALAERPAPVGQTPREVWVSVSHESAVMVISTDGFRVTHLLRPNIASNAIGAEHAAMPGGIAFSADGSKAYVAATVTDALLVYDAALKSHTATIPLEFVHNGQTARMNDPYFVIEHQGWIYVASHNSGNDTIAESSAGDPGIPPSNSGILGPDDVTVVDLSTDPNRSLPDFDVARIDTTTNTVAEMVRKMGSMIFGLAVHPPTNRIAVSSFDSQNGRFIGERSFPQGRVTINQVGEFLATIPASSKGRVILEGLGPQADNIVMPTDMTSDGAGRFYVAGYASSNIGVWAANAAYLGSISTGSGPRGLCVSNSALRLFCLNRAAGTVTAYDISTGGLPTTLVGTFTLPDPTFDRVKAGRQVFLTPNSGVGTPEANRAGCFSCHPDGRKDGLGWQISKYIDTGEGFTSATPPTEWKDLKGVMVTQDLRSLPDNPPYHWRGEQKDLEDFNGAFKNLLKGTELTDPSFALFKDYVFSGVYPANPRQQMNRVYSTDGLRGFTGFDNNVVTGDGQSCNNCHRMPTGTNCEATDPFIGVSPAPRAIKTAQLRAMFTKSSALANIDQNNPSSTTLWPMTGFGFAHEGLMDSVAQFNAFFFAGQPLAPEMPFVTQFIDELDTGLAPATAYSILLNQATASTSTLRLRNYLIAQAVNGNCDIAVKGRMFINGVWRNVGLFHDLNVGPAMFKSDDSTLGNFSWITLRQMATAGTAELLFMGVALGSGERIGVDRDRDGVYDTNEVNAGLDPLKPDTDGDYMWDSYDPFPLNPGGHLQPAGAPTVSNVQVVFANTNAIKIQYRTNTFSPTRVEFGESTAYGFFAGESLLPTHTPNLPSNHWKRLHTVFLRPQPNQSLQGLKDGVTHHFRIWTQGQNGQVAQTGDFTADTLSDLQTPNRRVGSIVLNGVDNLNGTFTYTATVTIVTNTGSIPNAGLVPGRFAFYDSSGAFHTVHLAVRGVGPVATFQATTPVGFQVAGDVTTFDVPMRLDDVLLDGAALSVAATSVPTGFGSSGTPGPVLNLASLQGRDLTLSASGSWCRNATACSGPDGDAGQFTATGPLPGDLYNLLGGEWQGGASAGTRFAIGTGTTVTIPGDASGLQLFFNDDLNAHGDNTGAVDVAPTVNIIAFAGHWPEGVLAEETTAP